MATKSFHENLIIDTEEKCQALLRAFEEADSGTRPAVEYPDTEKMVERGNKLLREGFLDDVIRNNVSE